MTSVATITEPTATAVRTSVRVNVPGADAATLDAVAVQTRVYAAALTRELDLGAAVDVTVTADAGAAPSLSIAGRSVAVEPPQGNDGIADSVCDALWRSRELLVTGEAVAEVRTSWPGGGGGTSGDADHPLRWLVRQCVRGCFRAGRLRSVVRLRELADRPRHEIERAFEEAVGPMGSCTVQLRIAPDLHAQWFGTTPGGPAEVEFAGLMDLMRDGLFYELGVLIPRVAVRADTTLAPGTFATTINDAPLPHRALGAAEFLVNDTPERLALLKVEARASKNPANLNDCAIVATGAEGRGQCEGFGLTTWDAKAHLVLQLSSDIRRGAGGLVNLALVDHMMERLREILPRLVEEAEGRFDEVTLTRTLRHLVEDGLSIRDLRAALGALLSIEGTTEIDSSKLIIFSGAQVIQYPTRPGRPVTELRPAEFAECVRVAMKRYISHKYTRGQSTLIVYLMDPVIEEMLTRKTLLTQDSDSIVAAVLREVGNLPMSSQLPVILTTIEVRRRLQEVIADAAPRLHVLSYQELSPDMNIQPIARISLA